MFGQRHQIAHGGLHLRKQRGALAFVVQVDPRRAGGVFEAVELPHEVAALATPRRQQRVGVGMHRHQRHLREGRVRRRREQAVGKALTRHAEQLASFNDVGPVVATGVRHRHQHLTVGSDRGQRLQRRLRQMGGTEQRDAPRQRTARAASRARQRCQKSAVHLRS